jgi:hypothetical protein
LQAWARSFRHAPRPPRSALHTWSKCDAGTCAAGPESVGRCQRCAPRSSSG